jgi:hypothetical protein
MKLIAFACALVVQLLGKVRDLFDKTPDVRYTSVPVWRPWRDF